MRGKPVIVIDPGHGMNSKGRYSRPIMDANSGKVVAGPRPHYLDDTEGFYREDIGTLLLAKSIKRMLDSEYEIHLTRDDKRNAKLYLSEFSSSKWKKKIWPKWKWVKDLTKQVKADLFISLHTNAGGGSGVVCFYNNEGSYKLAAKLCGDISKILNIPLRAVKRRNYLVMRNKGCTSVLLELLFHDNADEVKLLSYGDGIDYVAKLISKSIEEFIRSGE